MANENLKLKQRIEALEQALRPFAEIPPVLIEANENIYAVHYWCVIGHPGKTHFTIGDLRRAKEAVEAKGE